MLARRFGEFIVRRASRQCLSLRRQQVAARLLISERTVATHVGHILDKLGFKSRAQIAGWISADR